MGLWPGIGSDEIMNRIKKIHLVMKVRQDDFMLYNQKAVEDKAVIDGGVG